MKKDLLKEKVDAEQPNKYAKWVCGGFDGLELTLPIHVNFQFDKEDGDIANFQVFAAADKHELHDLNEYVNVEQFEYIRDGIFEVLKDRGEI